MLTNRQQSKYRPLVARAWQVECLRSGCHPDLDGARESWYRRQLLDACGIYTTKQAHPVKDYDKIMLHFASIAGDEALIDYFSRASERRHLFLIRREIERGAVTEAYVRGIARKMGFREDLDSLPADHLWRVWNALLRHNKRHEQQQALASA